MFQTSMTWGVLYINDGRQSLVDYKHTPLYPVFDTDEGDGDV